MVKLTPKQQQIYDYILSFTAQHGYPPSVREIGAAVGLKSPSTVHFHMKGLEEAGVIVKAEGKTRAISIPAMPLGAVAEETDPRENQIPILGNVAAGAPILAEECIEDYLTFDTQGMSGEHFALRVRGESMLGAGILPGDRVLSIDGKPIENWNAVAEGIGAGNGKPVTIVLSRGGSEVTLSLTPEAKTRANIFGEEKPAWLIGIRASTATGHLPLGPVEAIGAGFRQTWDMIAFTCESFVKLAQRVVPLDNVGGPILIAQMVGQQAEQGLSAVLLLAALISVNLGILNLLPIPILDGGHIVFFTLEMIMGRPVSATAREWSAKVGMALLLGLMILATWNDLTRLFS